VSAATNAAKLPAPPKTNALATRTAQRHGLAPKFLAALDLFCDAVEDETGVRPLVWETIRTNARQRFLYGFGRRYDDGRGIVTYSQDADETWHGYGLAADVIHPTLYWNAPESWWRTVERLAEQYGLTSGRDWDKNDATPERFVDSPHVQWGKCRRSPSPRAARLKRSGGLPAVWAEVGAG
jgi:hypothetical protein